MRKQLTKDERMKVYNKYNGHCAYCGCEIKYSDMQVDHIDSVYVAELHGQEADNTMENFMPACRQCNFYKSTYDIEKFRKNLQSIPDRLEREFIYRLAIKYGTLEKTGKPIKFYFEKMDELKNGT